MVKALKTFTKDAQLRMFNPIPAALLPEKIRSSTLLIYSCILSRALLSQMNGWWDDQGRVYVRYTVSQLCEAVGKSTTTVKDALYELETIGLIRRERQSQKVTMIYVNVPENCIAGRKTVNESRKFGDNKPDKCPEYGRNNGFSAAGKPTTSKYKSKNFESKERYTRREGESL